MEERTKSEQRKVVPTAAGNQTRERILDAAQNLFAASGFDGVSLRDVGDAADVPFASTTYHFKTKLGLYQAVFQRHAQALAQLRTGLLDAFESTGDVRADVYGIAAVIVEPLIALRDTQGGMAFTRLLGRELYDPNEASRGILKELVDPTACKALDLLRKAVPEASYEQICWGFYFATGAIAINHVNSGRLERLANGRCHLPDTKELSAELTTFVAAGWLGLFRQRA